MRLYPLGPGEILDRLTILALKILHGGDAGRETTHWEAEARHLEELLSARLDLQRAIRPRDREIASRALTLGAVNSVIWYVEDELRRWRREGCGPCDGVQAMTVAMLGLRAQALNDRRAALIHEINQLMGAEAPEEKVL